jgi:hypothetical protein
MTYEQYYQARQIDYQILDIKFIQKFLEDNEDNFLRDIHILFENYPSLMEEFKDEVESMRLKIILRTNEMLQENLKNLERI